LVLDKLFEEHWVRVGAPPDTVPKVVKEGVDGAATPLTDLDTRPVNTLPTVWSGPEIGIPAEVEIDSLMVLVEKPVGAPSAEAFARTFVIRKVRVGVTLVPFVKNT
jgi:hypothetical protein